MIHISKRNEEFLRFNGNETIEKCIDDQNILQMSLKIGLLSLEKYNLLQIIKNGEKVSDVYKKTGNFEENKVDEVLQRLIKEKLIKMNYF